MHQKARLTLADLSAYYSGQTVSGYLLETCDRISAASSGLVRNRRYRLREFPECFVGKDAVSWFVSTGRATDRVEGVKLGQQLLNAGLVRHVVDEHDFRDEFLFYTMTKAGGSVGARASADGKDSSGSGASDRNDLGSGRAGSYFDRSSFLEECNDYVVPFARAFVHTQLFSCFLQERMQRASGDLFDHECLKRARTRAQRLLRCAREAGRGLGFGGRTRAGALCAQGESFNLHRYQQANHSAYLKATRRSRAISSAGSLSLMGTCCGITRRQRG